MKSIWLAWIITTLNTVRVRRSRLRCADLNVWNMTDCPDESAKVYRRGLWGYQPENAPFAMLLQPLEHVGIDRKLGAKNKKSAHSARWPYVRTRTRCVWQKPIVLLFHMQNPFPPVWAMTVRLFSSERYESSICPDPVRILAR